MKLMINSFVCLLAVTLSTQAFARETVETVDQSSSSEDLTKLDAAKLYVRLGWAKLYLADLEKNDTIMGRLGVPVETSYGRTAYAVGVTAVNGGLIGATIALAQKARKVNAAGKATMNSDRVKYYVIQNGKNSTEIKAIQGAANLGIRPVGSKPSAEEIKPFLDAIEHNNANLQSARVAAKYTTMNRVVRGVGLTIGAGIVATLIYDGVRTWFQVQHNGAEVEQQKQDLRDFIAYAEDRLAHNEAPAQSGNASVQDAQ